VALGKACLVDEALAKRCVPLFVQELGPAAAPAVRGSLGEWMRRVGAGHTLHVASAYCTAQPCCGSERILRAALFVSHNMHTPLTQPGPI